MLNGIELTDGSSAADVWNALDKFLVPSVREKIEEKKWNVNLDGLTLRLLCSHAKELQVALGLAYPELSALEVMTVSLKLRCLLGIKQSDTSGDTNSIALSPRSVISSTSASNWHNVIILDKCQRIEEVEYTDDEEQEVAWYEDDDQSFKPTTEGKRLLFPDALMSMLSDSRSQGIIEFNDKIKAILLIDRSRFEDSVMPLYFDGVCNVKSFMRQLSYYNFNCINDRFDGLPLTYVHREIDLHSIDDIGKIRRPPKQQQRKHRHKGVRHSSSSSSSSKKRKIR